MTHNHHAQSLTKILQLLWKSRKASEPKLIVDWQKTEKHCHWTNLYFQFLGNLRCRSLQANGVLLVLSDFSSIKARILHYYVQEWGTSLLISAIWSQGAFCKDKDSITTAWLCTKIVLDCPVCSPVLSLTVNVRHLMNQKVQQQRLQTVKCLIYQRMRENISFKTCLWFHSTV